MTLLLTLLFAAQAFGATACGRFRATVSDARDPLGQGRLIAVVPSLRLTTTWALPAVPFGPVSLPKERDPVWIEFEGCNTAFPVWSGTFAVRCTAAGECTAGN